jgi:hypothetical protein
MPYVIILGIVKTWKNAGGYSTRRKQYTTGGGQPSTPIFYGGTKMLKTKKATTTATGSVNVPEDGLVHASVFQISMSAIGDAWGRGNNLDDQLVALQESGAEILAVMPFASGKDALHVQAVIVFRAPYIAVTGV